MADDLLSDDDVGLQSDSDVGLSDNSQQPQQQYVSDSDVGLMSDDDVGLGQGPQHESRPMAFGREVASEAAPALGGLAGAEAGAMAGGVVAPFLGPAAPVAPFVGGLVGAMGGGYLVAKGQQWAKQALGLDDSAQRALNQQDYPIMTAATDVGTNLVGNAPAKGIGLAARAVSGAIGGGIETASEAAQDEHFDPARIAMNVAGFAALPGRNRLGQGIANAVEGGAAKVGVPVPGRPGATPNPQAQPAQDEVTPTPQASNANTLGNSATAAPPASDNATVGQGGMGTTSGTRDQGKTVPPNGTATVTTGQTSPDVEAAAKAAIQPQDSMLVAGGGGTPVTQQPQAPKGNANRAAMESRLADLQNQLADAQAAQTQPPAPAQPPAAAAAIQKSKARSQPQEGNTPANAANNPPTQAQPRTPVKNAADNADLARQATEIAQQTGFLSPSYLQRKTKIPYNDAVDVIQSLRKQGVLGDPTSAGRYPLASATPPVAETTGQTAPQETPQQTFQTEVTINGKKVVAKGDARGAAQGAKAATEAAKQDAGLAPKPTVTPQPENTVGFTDATATSPNKVKEVPEAVHDLKERAPDETNLTPTEGQKEAGNYKKASGRILGREFKVETPAGEARRGTDENGNPFENRAIADYGYFRGTKGADSTTKKIQPVDGYVDNTGNKHFVVDQRNPFTGKFDEHKVIAHVADEARAREIYNSGFSDKSGPERMGAITEVPEDTLKEWLPKGWKRKPYAPDWQDKEPTRVAPVTEKVTEPTTAPPKQSNLIIKGITKDDGSPVHANTVSEARAAEAKVAKVNKAYDEIMAHPNLSNENLATSLKNASLRPKVLATLRKFVADTRGGYRPVNGTDGFVLRQIVQDFNNTKAEGVRSGRSNVDEVNPDELSPSLGGKEQAYRDLATDIVMLRAGGDAAKEVRKRYRIEADVAKDQRRVPSAEELPDELHPVSGDREEGAALSDEEANEPHLNTADETTPAVAKEQKSGGRVLQRTEPSTKGPSIEEQLAAARAEHARLKAELGEKPDIDASKKEDAPKLGKQLGVDNAAKTKPVWHRATTREPPRVEDKGKKYDAETIKKINDDLKAGKLNLGDLTASKSVRDFLKNNKGGLDLDAIIDSIKSGATKVGSWLKKGEDKIGAGVESVLGKPSQVTSYRAKEAKTEGEKAARQVDELLFKAKQKDVTLGNQTLRYVNDTGKKFKTSELADIANRREDDLKYQAPVRLQRMFDSNDETHQELRRLDPDNVAEPIDLQHVMHIAKGDAGSKYDDMFGTQAGIDPISGLTTSPKGSALNRVFWALTNQKTGERFVIKPNDDGYTVYKNGKAERVADPDFEAKIGNKLDIVDRNGNTHNFQLGAAKMKEIEQHARGEGGKKIEYYHNALLSAATTHYQLNRMLNNIRAVNEIKNADWFKNLSTGKVENVPLDRNGNLTWKMTDHPNFRGLYMDPKIANVLDQHAAPGIENLEGFRTLAQRATQSIFINPVPHISNVGGHYLVEKGFDWLRPTTYHSLAVDGAKAVKSVLTQDSLQDQLRDHGIGSVYGSIRRQNQMVQIARMAGEDIKREPWKWDPFARTLGVGPSDLVKYLYGASSKTMWAVNDMMLTQAVLQRMRQQGMTMEDAIKHVERHIPNYRIPADIMGSRGLSKVLEDPAIVAFGRYHSGVFNSFANIYKDIVKGNAADKVNAAGHLAAMAFGVYVMYPYLDKMAQAVTGDDNASVRRRGPWAVGSHIADAASGKSDLMNVARNAATISPLLQTGLETLNNRDWRGKDILDRGTTAQALHGNVGAGVRAFGQEASHAVKSLVSPVGTAANAANAGRGVGQTLRDQFMDLKEPSPKALKYERNINRINQRATNTRLKHPNDFIEKGFNRLTGK